MREHSVMKFVNKNMAAKAPPPTHRKEATFYRMQGGLAHKEPPPP